VWVLLGWVCGFFWAGCVGSSGLDVWVLLGGWVVVVLMTMTTTMPDAVGEAEPAELRSVFIF
jgi:hypothetical protein